MVSWAATAALLISATGARGALVTNGSFESTSNVTPPNNPDNSPGQPGSGGVGMIGYNTQVTGWSNPDLSYTNQTGYNLVFNSATASTTGAVGYNGDISLYGPGNGFNNGLKASPDGGNFVGAEGDTRYNGPIQQTVSGLVTGQQYTLSFYWAVQQMYGAGGTPNESWQASLGSQTQSTAFVTLPSVGGFTGWQLATMKFTATNSSEVLSFLANEGGPYGGAPITLLDGVSLSLVPEPVSIGVWAIGLLAMTAGRMVLGRQSRARAEITVRRRFALRGQMWVRPWPGTNRSPNRKDVRPRPELLVWRATHSGSATWR